MKDVTHIWHCILCPGNVIQTVFLSSFWYSDSNSVSPVILNCSPCLKWAVREISNCKLQESANNFLCGEHVHGSLRGISNYKPGDHLEEFENIVQAGGICLPNGMCVCCSPWALSLFFLSCNETLGPNYSLVLMYKEVSFGCLWKQAETVWIASVLGRYKLRSGRGEIEFNRCDKHEARNWCSGRTT
jgi:hypothetical protein